MDNGSLALLIPVLALAIPVSAVIMGGLARIAKLRVEEAKLKAGGNPADLDRIVGHVAELRRELDEVHERLDFTERMLAQSKQPEPLRRPE